MSVEKNYREAERWFKNAQHQEGSWWPDWEAWVPQLDKTQVAARRPGDGKLGIIEFGAHPDDCEVSVGGTAARAKARGDHVKFVTFTRGNRGHYFEEYRNDREALSRLPAGAEAGHPGADLLDQAAVLGRAHRLGEHAEAQGTAAVVEARQLLAEIVAGVLPGLGEGRLVAWQDMGAGRQLGCALVRFLDQVGCREHFRHAVPRVEGRAQLVCPNWMLPSKRLKPASTRS